MRRVLIGYWTGLDESGRSLFIYFNGADQVGEVIPASYKTYSTTSCWKKNKTCAQFYPVNKGKTHIKKASLKLWLLVSLGLGPKWAAAVNEFMESEFVF